MQIDGLHDSACTAAAEASVEATQVDISLLIAAIASILLAACSSPEDSESSAHTGQSARHVAAASSMVVATAQAAESPPPTKVVNVLNRGVSVNAAAVAKKLVETSSYVEGGDAQPDLVPPKIRAVDYPSDGVGLGQGWDSLRDVKTQGQCVEFSPADAGGQIARVETRRVYDTDSLRRSVRLDASVAAKATFGVGDAGGSAKYSFVSTSEVNNQYLNLVLKAVVQNGVTFASPAKTTNGALELTSFAKQLLGNKGDDDQKRAAFLKYCGDSFVSAIERGAELAALYQFSSKARTDSKENTLSFSASGSYLAFSGSGSTSKTTTSVAVTKNEVSGLKYMHVAHRGLRLPLEEASIKDSLASLGSAPDLGDAQPYRVQLVRYDSLPGWQWGSVRSAPATREALLAYYFRLSDLSNTVRDIWRNPQGYVLDYPPDVQARGTLTHLLKKRIDQVADLLTKCEAAKNKEISDSERGQILAACATRSDDIQFTDYPLRALMPLPRVRKQTFFTETTRAQLDKDIATLKTQFANTRVPFGYCPNLPALQACVAIQNQIAAKERERALYIQKNDQFDVAESRYRYWIEGIAEAREEDGALGGTLAPTELAMYRREIYCQYGVSPDAASCPEKSLIDLLRRGNVVKVTKVQTLDVKGDTKPAPLEGWKSLEEKIAANVATTAGRAPHYFELDNPEYTFEASAFRVKGTVRITYFEFDEKKVVERLLAAPL